jgi:methyl-accepting chemotaxis protein
MRKANIGRRISMGFASVILITLVLGVFAFSRLVGIRHHADHIARQTSPTVQLCTQLGMRSRDAVQMVYKHIGSSDPEDMGRLEKIIRSGAVENSRVMGEVEKLNPGDRYQELLKRITVARGEYGKIRESVLACSRQGTNRTGVYSLARTQLDPALEAYMAGLTALTEQSRMEAEAASNGIQTAVQVSETAIGVGLGLALLVGIGVAVLIIRSTSAELSRIASTLSDGSAQVTAASGLVSANSQTLAEGASEQAASLEETSASLEELASMTQRNAENARKAEELAKAARAAAERGVSDMAVMTSSMEAIKVSSDDIAKIIKTIDEIAFQTNLLALNAAVEAARAGESGMGFAVVADEVRGLAQRCAQAAKETSEIIASAVAKTGQGVEMSAMVAQTLGEIVTQARQVDALVAEVATASHEQTQGLSQVNTAVGQMDKVTQRNAASAEETASAAEELAAQALATKASVAELLSFVGVVARAAAEGQRPARLSGGVLAKATPAPRVGTRSAGCGDPGRPDRRQTRERSEPPAHELVVRETVPLEGAFHEF